MENKVCKNKKCQKQLPENYKYKYCEACRNRQVDRLKKGGKTVVSFGLTIASIALILTNGDKNQDNK